MRDSEKEELDPKTHHLSVISLLTKAIEERTIQSRRRPLRDASRGKAVVFLFLLQGLLVSYK